MTGLGELLMPSSVLYIDCAMQARCSMRTSCCLCYLSTLQVAMPLCHANVL